MPHLTGGEIDLYRFLTEHAYTHPTGLLLEQERIPWPLALRELELAVRPNADLTSRRDSSHRPEA